jgi:hypothetical protein
LLAAVVRGKAAGGARQIADRPDLVELARRIAEGYGIRSLFNVQVRGEGVAVKLVEVNPRASAGLHQSCMGGINLLHAAIQLELTGQWDIRSPATGARLVNVMGAVHQAELSRPEARPVATA